MGFEEAVETQECTNKSSETAETMEMEEGKQQWEMEKETERRSKHKRTRER